MPGDSRQDVRVSSAIERLSELLSKVDSDIESVCGFLNRFHAGAFDASLIRLETFDADFCAGQLYGDLALAGGYFDQLGVGPDANVLLKEARELRDNVHDYGVGLVRLTAVESGRSGNDTAAAREAR